MFNLLQNNGSFYTARITDELVSNKKFKAFKYYIKVHVFK